MKLAVGDVFERLSVVGLDSDYAICACTCGTTKRVRKDHLRSGKTLSCGCLKVERVRIHGRSRDPLYRTWERIISRCENEKSRAYPDYGGRGIRVCERWRESFEAFAEDIGERPSDKHTIERNDVNGNYEPGNCRWATRLEQNQNTRRNRFLTFEGETLCLSEWARRKGVGKKTVEGRLNRGWSVEEALTVAPVRTRDYSKAKRVDLKRRKRYSFLPGHGGEEFR